MPNQNATEVLQFMQDAINNMEGHIEKLDNQLQTFIAHRLMLENCKLNFCFADESANEVLLGQIKRLQNENQEILETLKIKCEKVELYRGKYLSTLAIVEGQKNEMEKIKLENGNIQQHLTAGFAAANTHLSAELEALQELPEILQTKLNEFESLKKKLTVADQTVAALSHDLEGCINQNAMLRENLQQEEAACTGVTTKLQVATQKLNEIVLKYEDLSKQADTVERLEKEKMSQDDTIKNLKKQLDILKEKSSDYISQMKERSEALRRKQFVKIAELEEEIVQLRSALTAATKDRDEVRSKFENKSN